ncbi:MAG: hypothetical protein KC425_11630 [Anaerolineales bacterium]|nr:hypothetical protein [Anaerolineales bacterium]
MNDESAQLPDEIVWAGLLDEDVCNTLQQDICNSKWGQAACRLAADVSEIWRPV